MFREVASWRLTLKMSRIGSPWLRLGWNSARTNPTASRDLFKPLPALLGFILTPLRVNWGAFGLHLVPVGGPLASKSRQNDLQRPLGRHSKNLNNMCVFFFWQQTMGLLCLREFACELTSSWPPARVGEVPGGSPWTGSAWSAGIRGIRGWVHFCAL